MATLPPFIDTDVKLLLTELTSPEMPVKFDAPSEIHSRNDSINN